MNATIGKNIVRSFSVLSYAIGGAMLAGGILAVILSIFKGLWVEQVVRPGLFQQDTMFVIVLLMVMSGIAAVVLGFFLLWVGRGLWTFEPWSRWVLVTIGILLFVSAIMSLPVSVMSALIMLAIALILLLLFMFSTTVSSLFAQREQELQDEYDETLEVLEHARKRIEEERKRAEDMTAGVAESRATSGSPKKKKTAKKKAETGRKKGTKTKKAAAKKTRSSSTKKASTAKTKKKTAKKSAATKKASTGQKKGTARKKAAAKKTPSSSKKKTSTAKTTKKPTKKSGGGRRK